jgi:hypothetical protein
MLTHPGGRESLRPLPEALEPDHPVPPERPHVEVAELGGSAAFLPIVYSASRSRPRHGPASGNSGRITNSTSGSKNLVAGANVAVPPSLVDVADDLDVVL